ncbi:MAG: STAS/SEC14 domain-containing protein [Flavisolibacter sp.]
MLQKINDIPSYVAGFRATGEVTKDDYDSILVPEIEKVGKQHGHIHFLMVLETPVKDFSLGAWMQDAWQGLKHFRGWKKVAIVTPEKGVEKFTNIFSAIIPGKAKGFPPEQFNEAKNWVATEE